MKIKLYMQQRKTSVLGPAQRYALWVQGCNKRCPGCISPDAQPLEGGYEVEVECLANEILSQSNIEGITISGGEPFLQQKALSELIDQIRSKRDLGVMVYTGMKYSEIKGTPLAQRCDLIIDGEYIDSENDDKSLRGSSNQNAICVTNRYRPYVNQQFAKPGRKIEFVLKNNQIDLIGIPPRNALTEITRN